MLLRLLVDEPQSRANLAISECSQPSALSFRLLIKPGAYCLHKIMSVSREITVSTP